MCRFCWHNVKENLDGRCPACRQPYDPQNYEFSPEDYEELSRREHKSKHKQQEKQKRKVVDLESLADRRVIQSNLVYITNIALDIAKEDVRLSFLQNYMEVGILDRVGLWVGVASA